MENNDEGLSDFTKDLLDLITSIRLKFDSFRKIKSYIGSIRTEESRNLLDLAFETVLYKNKVVYRKKAIWIQSTIYEIDYFTISDIYNLFEMFDYFSDPRTLSISSDIDRGYISIWPRVDVNEFPLIYANGKIFRATI